MSLFDRRCHRCGREAHGGALDPVTCWDCVAVLGHEADARQLASFRHWSYDPSVFVLVHRTTHYEIDLERCTTAAQTLDWIAQTAGKSWATAECIGELVLALDLLLELQARLCSFGVSKTIAPRRILLARHQELGVRRPRQRHGAGA